MKKGNRSIVLRKSYQTNYETSTNFIKEEIYKKYKTLVYIKYTKFILWVIAFTRFGWQITTSLISNKRNPCSYNICKKICVKKYFSIVRFI